MRLPWQRTAPAPVATVTRPIVINATGEAQAEQARFRLDQIAAHLALHPVVSDAKKAEFRDQARLLATSLWVGKIFSDAEYRDALRRCGAGGG